MNKLLMAYSEAVAERIDYLIGGFVTARLTHEEHLELDEWIEANDDNMIVFEKLTEPNEVETYMRRLNGGM